MTLQRLLGDLVGPCPVIWGLVAGVIHVTLRLAHVSLGEIRIRWQVQIASLRRLHSRSSETLSEHFVRVVGHPCRGLGESIGGSELGKSIAVVVRQLLDLALVS